MTSSSWTTSFTTKPSTTWLDIIVISKQILGDLAFRCIIHSKIPIYVIWQTIHNINTNHSVSKSLYSPLLLLCLYSVECPHNQSDKGPQYPIHVIYVARKQKQESRSTEKECNFHTIRKHGNKETKMKNQSFHSNI